MVLLVFQYLILLQRYVNTDITVNKLPLTKWFPWQQNTLLRDVYFTVLATINMNSFNNFYGLFSEMFLILQVYLVCQE